ncbi:cysteine proteinase [Phanerochaete sordida]|uniref:Ubiquitin carboxyl-terminal hydrolase n=1 Tax=Phanerochaete sordida TaxID=48140 RepID=A0A9P3FWG0_9APHY|nr:cysteine proteinase [Phanerochaete sordida]
MLAAPLQSTSAFDSDLGTQYRPAKDLQAFNALLPPAIEFVKGSSTGTIAPGEGKYQPINAAPPVTPAKGEKGTNAADTRPPSQAGAQAAGQAGPSKAAKQAQAAASSSKQLYAKAIDMSWPPQAKRGSGLMNTGNTCFLNSALQCLLHTPPLLRVLLQHGHGDPCQVSKGAFCMACSMRDLAHDSFKAKQPMVPYAITRGLQHIAKTMRRGRQEDSHEFLRYAVDALQKSCLAGQPQPQKVDPKLAETTWVHKIFGGRLRSRVKCLSCGYNSDTFDSILDLSIDIFGVNNLRDALRKFVAVDQLRGQNKYKCEKCKKHVAADKQFTVHDAPMVLTVHLKRFSPMGRKIPHIVKYDERVSLQPVMSEGQHGPTYSLYGVISHAGGGPSSGHYYAHIKDASGQWYEMNDDAVIKQSSPPLGMKSAYVLFYLRDKGQALEAVTSQPQKPVSTPKPGLVASMKKRKIVESDDEAPEGSSPKQRRFIGPLLPSPMEKPDPQAESLKKKIAQQAVSPTKPSAALQSLSQYADDDEDDDDLGEKITLSSGKPLPELSASSAEDSTTASARATTPPKAPSATLSTSLGPVSAQSFYGPSSKSESGKKQKHDEKHSSPLSQYARSPLKHDRKPRHKLRGAFNPYSRLKGNKLSFSSPKKRSHYKDKL